jgi:hypothetical protein
MEKKKINLLLPGVAAQHGAKMVSTLLIKYTKA